MFCLQGQYKSLIKSSFVNILTLRINSHESLLDIIPTVKPKIEHVKKNKYLQGIFVTNYYCNKYKNEGNEANMNEHKTQKHQSKSQLRLKI